MLSFASHLFRVPRTGVFLFVPSFLSLFILTIKRLQKYYQLPPNCQLLIFCYIPSSANALWHLILKLSFPWLPRLHSLGYPISFPTTPMGSSFSSDSSVDSVRVLFTSHLTCCILDLFAFGQSCFSIYF